MKTYKPEINKLMIELKIKKKEKHLSDYFVD